MTIDEIAKKYPDKIFIEGSDNAADSDQYFDVDNLDDLMKLDDTFLYEIMEVGSSAEEFLENRPIPDDFIEYFKKNHKAEYKKLDAAVNAANDEFVIIPLNYRNVRYYQESDLDVSAIEAFNMIAAEYKEYAQTMRENEARAARDELFKKVDAFIMSYKKEYADAASVKEKDAIIKRISAGLRTEYDIDSRTEPKYIRENIELMLK